MYAGTILGYPDVTEYETPPLKLRSAYHFVYHRNPENDRRYYLSKINYYRKPSANLANAINERAILSNNKLREKREQHVRQNRQSLRILRCKAGSCTLMH